MISIANLEEKPSLDLRDLPTQWLNPSLTESQSTSLTPDQQMNCSGSNNDNYNAILREFIMDDVQESLETSGNAQLNGTEGLDRTVVIPENFWIPPNGEKTSIHDASTEMQIDSTFQPTPLSLGQQEMGYPSSIDPVFLFKIPIQVDNGHESKATETITVHEDRNTNFIEREDSGMDFLLESIQDEYPYGGGEYHQSIIREVSAETSGRAKGIPAAKSPRLHRSRKESSITTRRSGCDLIKATPERTGATRVMQNISKKHIRDKTFSNGLLKTQLACLDAYILQHRTRYEKLGLPCPGDFVESAKIKIRLANLGLDTHANVLRAFSFAIAGCESLFGLQEILRAYRNNDAGPRILAREVSNAKRLETIKGLSGEEAYLNLLKNCHVHKLFSENIDPLCNSNDNFIVSTTENVKTRASKELGNPRNSAESRITKSIMREVYPKVHLKSSDYRSKYDEISGLRRSGRRLDILVSRFGKGILGLLPFAQGDSRPGSVGKITDFMQVLP